MGKMQTWQLGENLLFPGNNAVGFSLVKPGRTMEGGIVTEELLCIGKHDFILP